MLSNPDMFKFHYTSDRNNTQSQFVACRAFNGVRNDSKGFPNTPYINTMGNTLSRPGLVQVIQTAKMYSLYLRL